ncbi:hypothetical protein [Alishewanella sp. SMS8]|uniref:hypothetical protein n=1 Tax=Alishewanella sp. SMS8 TaxID=2994676 RepID=UPI0027417AD0|nr:hypothetical protein [Alishewanella sp. SMS8]MDP5459892.1 hypothetical protein [Alishewanella sp. SMS8]
MMIDGIVLDDDFVRTDGYWPAHRSNSQFASNGALLVELATMQAGEPITLNSGDHWIRKSKVDELLAHIRQGLDSFTITLPDGSSHSAMWDYSNQPLAAEPLNRETYPNANSWLVNVQLKFIKL